jgi:hypothetical protein
MFRVEEHARRRKTQSFEDAVSIKKAVIED